MASADEARGFFGGLARRIRRVARRVAPVLRSVARVAGPIALAAVPVVGAAAGALLLRRSSRRASRL